MSEYEEDKFMEQIEKWDSKQAKRSFISSMERKLHRKERRFSN